MDTTTDHFTPLVLRVRGNKVVSSKEGTVLSKIAIKLLEEFNNVYEFLVCLYFIIVNLILYSGKDNIPAREKEISLLRFAPRKLILMFR